jgi:hypothetical protein
MVMRMKEITVCFICILAMMAFVLPAVVADADQNALNASTISNASQNVTTNNTTLNATENASLNASANITQTIAQATIENPSSPASPIVSEDTVPVAVNNTDSDTRVLRAGFEKTKPLSNLDVYGNKSVHELGNNSGAAGSAFNASQRLGNVSRFSYNTNNTKQLYNVSEYSRTKPTYQVPSSLSSKPVYDIEKYSAIKAVNSIP